MTKIIRKWPREVKTGTKKYDILQDLLKGISRKDGVVKYGNTFAGTLEALINFNGYDIRSFRVTKHTTEVSYKIVGRMFDDGYEDYIKMEEAA